jgi:enediyne biosynthesis protein E4
MNHFLRFEKYRLGAKHTSVFVLLNIFFCTFPEQSYGQNFIMRTQAAGLATVIGTNGVAVADYDRDGDLDIFFVAQDTFKINDKRTWNRLFSNNGDGTFRDVTSASGIVVKSATAPFSYMGYKMGASWGDYDNDGYPDLFVTNFGSNQLFHNNGDGTFTDVTAQAGVGGGTTQVSSSAVWFDYDRDGDLDLYVSVWADYATGPRDTRNRMYENLGNRTFKDVSEASGLADTHSTWTSIAIDANNDGYLDLFLANDFGPTRLYINNHDKTFTDRTTDFGLDGTYEGMGLAIADCDANGFFDIYLTNVTENGNPSQINPLFLNTGNNSFTKVVDAGVSHAGWAWGTEFFDLENDGKEDLFVVNGYFSQLYTKRLFHNESDSTGVHFREISRDVGLIDSAEARGLVIFDYNNDGRPDILISNFTKAPSLYENLMGQDNWLKITLEGTVSNRDAFGAIVEVRANGKSFRKYHHGAQFLGQNILPLHFGLGTAQHIDSIIVKWPSGNVDGIGGLGVDQTVLIRENSGVVNSVRPISLNLTRAPDEPTLLENYPNPFNPVTTIRFSIVSPQFTILKVYDILGRVAATLVNEMKQPGVYTVSWDAGDMASGIYLYSMTVNHGFVKVGKMLHLK